MPVASQVKGFKFHRPVYYNRILQALEEVNDNTLQRISYNLRYLYAQYLTKFHKAYQATYDSNTGLYDLSQVSQNIWVPGMLAFANYQFKFSKIGTLIDSVRNTTITAAKKAEDLQPPPGSDLDFPFGSGSDYTTREVFLWQYGTIPNKPSFATLDSSSYLIFDKNWQQGSLRTAGGNQEQDILHTIVNDAINQIDKGDGVGSYYVDVVTPQAAGVEPGTWYNCGLFTEDILFNPADAQSSYKGSFSASDQIKIPYYLWIKTAKAGGPSFFAQESIGGFMGWDPTGDGTNGAGIKEKSFDFEAADVYYNTSTGTDTLANAPSLYTDVLLPILYRAYPRYVINSSDPGALYRKGIVYDNVYSKNIDELGINPGGTYTRIREPKFTSDGSTVLNPNTTPQRVLHTYYFYSQVTLG